MKITQRQLRQIIKEELMREMRGIMPIGKGIFGKGPAAAMSRLRMMRKQAEAPVGPPNLGPASSMSVSCGTCMNFCPDTNTCMAFGDYPVSADMVCDAWQPES